MDGIERDVPLAPRTTLELGGAADHFLVVHDASSAAAGIRWAREHDLPVHVLGGGSNVLIPDTGVRGLVIQWATSEPSLFADGRVHADAGTDWDALVSRCVASELAGVECLAGIPGSVGATPIQNVGAYGQDVAETITRVGCIDLRTLERVELDATSCGFAYRNSRFKRTPGAFWVTDVTFQMTPGGSPARRYAELIAHTEPDAPLARIREVVVALRRSKSMVLDPGDPNRRSAGSFFTNPLVSKEQADAVVARSGRESIPMWPEGEQVKLSAGWLIEQAGFEKGMRNGAFGLSTKHALALVHHGGGTTAELLAFAERIVLGVQKRFGVTLEREPRLLTE